MSAADQPEPMPVKNIGPCIQDLVNADITARKEVGLKKYGTVLQPHNGRDALMDAYQEALDLCMYLRQVLEERDTGPVRECASCGDVNTVVRGSAQPCGCDPGANWICEQHRSVV